MQRTKTLSRRDLLAASMLAPLAAGTAHAAGAAQQGRTGKVLVAYLSRTGNTRVIAGQIHRAIASTLFDIQPAVPYPDDYQQTVEQARRERDGGIRPALRGGVADIGDVETVFLGFPIWGETAPPLIRSFLAHHDLAGKTLVPFITHGGYGIGNSLDVLASHAPRARLVDAGFVMQAPQEKQTLERVTAWLGKLPANARQTK